MTINKVKPLLIILGIGLFSVIFAVVLIKLGLPGGVAGGVVFIG